MAAAKFGCKVHLLQAMPAAQGYEPAIPALEAGLA